MTTSRSDPLSVLAQTVSTSYAPPLPPATLNEALHTGSVPPGFEAHLTVLVDETPIALIARVLDTTEGAERQLIRRNLVTLEERLRGQGRMRRWMRG